MIFEKRKEKGLEMCRWRIEVRAVVSNIWGRGEGGRSTCERDSRSKKSAKSEVKLFHLGNQFSMLLLRTLTCLPLAIIAFLLLLLSNPPFLLYLYASTLN